MTSFTSFSLASGGPEDGAVCHAVYVSAVRMGAEPLYTAAQRQAWAPSEAPEPWIAKRLEAGTSWLAWEGRRLLGFLVATEAGHLDLFFVMPNQRRGPVAPALYEAYEAWALARGLRRLTTDASHLARRFLEKRGWTALAEEQVARNGAMISRWSMALDLVETTDTEPPATA